MCALGPDIRSEETVKGRPIRFSENEYRLAQTVLADADAHQLTSIERCALLAFIMHRRDNACIGRVDAAIVKKLLRTMTRKSDARVWR